MQGCVGNRDPAILQTVSFFSSVKRVRAEMRAARERKLGEANERSAAHLRAAGRRGERAHFSFRAPPAGMMRKTKRLQIDTACGQIARSPKTRQ